MYINISKVDFGKCDCEVVPQLNGLYITPADASAINVTPNDSYYNLHGKRLKYSFDGKKWKNWNGNVTIEPEQKMYLKGKDDYVWNESTSGKLITSDGYYNVGGDISSLTNFITEVKTHTFYNLFHNDSYIKDASSLILPSTTLAKYCYTQMFYCCYSLTTAPELPATTLAESCYSGMFYGCYSLTTAPELHATTLAEGCYQYMFSGCSSLTTAPELMATELQYRCYSSMFDGCTSLNNAPELLATALSGECYEYMFSGCSSLTTAPELPSAILASSCYRAMFQGCTSLANAPELPATTLTEGCYQNMFFGCSSLTTAPELNATTLAPNCYKEMFMNCTSLYSITMLATDISATDCLTEWVQNVAPTGTFTKAASMTSLPTGTSGIPAGWTVADYTDYMTLSALGDGEITITIPASINSSYATSLSYSKDKSNWTDTIIDDTEQTISIPVTSGENVYLKGIAKQLGNSSTGVNINSTSNINASGNIMSLLYGNDYKDKVALPSGSAYTFYRLFRNNTHLINAENIILQSTTLSNYCYTSMFRGCTSLTTAPELPATTLKDGCYDGMFYGCTSLTAAPELPATRLAYSCYSQMFYYCRSLTTAPVLPATTLTQYCYQYMFNSCTSLNNITMLATDISASGCLNNWVQGVSSTGTFTKAAEMTTLPTGINGIPSGWTVADYTDYMTLSALGDGEITITIPAAINSSYATSLSYSKDKSSWNETIIDDTAQTITIPVTSGENVYLKGIAKQLGIYGSYVNINSTANINASGNIMSLLYGDDYKDKVAVQSYLYKIFNSLFRGNTHLISAEALILPATKLVSEFYSNMFEGCSSLTAAPELHATTLASSCYSNMFKGCTSLTTAPELPATTLASYCYQSMFKGCTSLTTAPELPATTLASYCYQSMFSGCASLTAAPELHATTLASSCYSNMFLNCSSLTAAPELHSTTLASSCYDEMFKGCTSLTAAPELPATTLASSCYSNMFNGCTSLTDAPELPATTLTDDCYWYMFYKCSKLNSITMLATDISASSCLEHWVDGVAPNGTFTKAASMTSLPIGESGIPSGWTVVDYGAA